MSVELGDVSYGDRLELRFAVVMTGGVSLAVWMGGVAHELNRLVRSDADGYQELLDLTACDARVDVISGTSAGGLNGALLAMAQVHDADMIRVRDLWLDKGELESLLRSPGDADPPSLMRGDEYFLKGIQDGLKALVNRPQGSLPPPADVPVHLIITSTLLDGMHRGVPDSFGSIIHDRDHRGEFTFRRGGGLLHHSDECIHATARAEDDDFSEPETLNRIALAARSTASFPFAFEPSFCPVGSGSGDRPDMACHANFPISRYVIDGGVLVNQPLGPALRAIFAQEAANQVRRLLLFVVPDPGSAVRDAPDAQDPLPSLAQVGYASLMKLPRNQSIFSDLDQIRAHNDRVAGQRRRRQAAVESQRTLIDLATPLYARYRRARAEWLADLIVRLIARGASARGAEVRPGAGDLPLWDRPTLRAPFLEHLAALPPAEFPGPEERVEEWFTTLDTVERAGALALDLLSRPLRLTNPRRDAYDRSRAALRRLRADVHSALRDARAARPPLRPDEVRAVAADALAALEDNRLDADEAKDIIERVLGDPGTFTSFMRRIADAVREGAADVRAACEIALEDDRVPDEPVKEALALASVFVELDADEVLRRMLALEVVEIALADQPPGVEQALELLQLSADAPNGFDVQTTAAEKLAGLQLAHFGAFYKRSWRANDWMWGRLDAAQRLTTVLLDPARLRQLGYGAQELFEHVERIAFDGLSPADRRTLETAQPMRWDPDVARRELELVADVSRRPPASLPMCTQAIARRLQLGILAEELGPVAEAVRDDDAAGSADTEANRFADRVREAGKEPAAAAIVDLFRSCKIGLERLSLDGSPLMARTATHAAAVTTAAVGGKYSGLGTRALKVRRGVRGVGLALFLLVRNAMVGTRIGAMAVTAALAAGGALLAIGLLAGHGGAQVLGATLLLGGLGAAAMRSQWKRALVGLAVLAVLVAAPRLVVLIADEPDWFSDLVDTFEGLWVGLWLVAGAVWLGNLSIVWPQDES
jgi:patatin-related protein